MRHLSTVYNVCYYKSKTSHSGHIFFLHDFHFCGYFSKINFFLDYFLDSDQVEIFLGSDPCPNCLQGYKQGTLPNESAIKLKCMLGIVYFSN